MDGDYEERYWGKELKQYCRMVLF